MLEPGQLAVHKETGKEVVVYLVLEQSFMAADGSIHLVDEYEAVE